MRRNRLFWTTPLAAGLLFASLGSPATRGLAAQQSPGFLFDTPRAALGVRIGFHLPRAGGGNGAQSLWDLTRENLTVETSDLGGIYFAGDLSIRLSERFDVTLSAGHSVSQTPSEFRDWVDVDDNPIEQTTEFTTTPATIGVKAYLFDRGRSVGRFAWIPRTWNPYAGIAAGFVWYRFEQRGDFVDFETLDVFRDNFRSRGRARTITFAGGLERSLGRRLQLTGEARYGLGSAPLGHPFVGFPDLDLAGFEFTIGIGFRV